MNLKGAKVLVTGSMGFLGSHVCRRLQQEGAVITGTIHNREERERLPGVTYLKGDLTSQEFCSQVTSGQDYLFMCAANTAGAAVIKHTPLAHVTPNVLMNTLLLEAAHKAGVKRALFISSGAAYPATGSRPAVEEDMFTADPEDVYFSVGWMKRYAEILCRTYAEKINKPMAVTVVRPSNVYGPDDKFDPDRSHVTAALIRRVATRENPMSIWGTGEDIRDLIYIDDFIEGLFKAFAYDAPYFVVNIASGQGISVRQVLELLIEVDNFKDASVSYDPSKPSTTPIRLLSNRKAHELLQFTAQTSLRDGLTQTLAWFRANVGR